MHTGTMDENVSTDHNSTQYKPAQIHFEEDDSSCYDDYDFSEYDEEYLGGGFNGNGCGGGRGRKIKGKNSEQPKKGRERLEVNVYSSRHARLMEQRKASSKK